MCRNVVYVSYMSHCVAAKTSHFSKFVMPSQLIYCYRCWVAASAPVACVSRRKKRVEKNEMRFLFMGFDLICCCIIVGRVELIIVTFIIY